MSRGREIRALVGTKNAGLNRVQWDLRATRRWWTWDEVRVAAVALDRPATAEAGAPAPNQRRRNPQLPSPRVRVEAAAPATPVAQARAGRPAVVVVVVVAAEVSRVRPVAAGHLPCEADGWGQGDRAEDDRGRKADILQQVLLQVQCGSRYAARTLKPGRT